MLIRIVFGITSIALLFFSSSMATTVVPDPCLSEATINSGTNQTVALFCLPNGMGLSLNEAEIYNDGSVVDATITLHVMDWYGTPIPQYPAEDMWLESYDGGLALCPGGSIADFYTDVNGVTSWTSPLRAGGHSMSSCVVLISGMALCQAPFDMYFNSADVNGDGIVNLSDVAMFATAVFYEFDYSVDFLPDGVLNLSDIGRFASAIGASCP